MALPDPGAGRRSVVAGAFPLGGPAAIGESPPVPAELTVPSFAPEILIYGLAVFGLLFGLWLYYDRRDRAFFDAGRRKISFHCVRCDRLYTQPAGTETAPCPQCGHENVRLKF